MTTSLMNPFLFPKTHKTHKKPSIHPKNPFSTQVAKPIFALEKPAFHYLSRAWLPSKPHLPVSLSNPRGWDNARNIYQGKTRPDQTRPDKTRQDKTRQDKTRQDKTRIKRQETRDKRQGTRYKRQGARNKRQETRDKRQETRNERQETRDTRQSQKTRDKRPETRDKR